MADEEEEFQEQRPADDTSNAIPYNSCAEYLDDWFKVLDPQAAAVVRGGNTYTRTEMLPWIGARTRLTLEKGISLPVERAAEHAALSLVEKMVVLVLLKDVFIAGGEGISNLLWLLGSLDLQGLQQEIELRNLLERDSRLRRSGIIECDQDPVPVRRAYRLAPGWRELLLGEEETAHPLPTLPDTELAAFERLDTLVTKVFDEIHASAGDQKGRWAGPVLNGPGWDPCSRSRREFLLYVKTLSRSELRFGRITRERGLTSAEAICLALVAGSCHRLDSGLPVPSFAEFLHVVRPGGRDPLRFLEAGSRLSSLMLLQPIGGAPARQRILLSEPLARDLIPYHASQFAVPSADALDEPNASLYETREPRLKLAQVVLGKEARGRIQRVLAARDRTAFLRSEWGFDEIAAGSQGTVLLFHGTPGTGKSITAEAIAGEMGVRLMVLKTEGILSKYVGQAEKRLSEAFQAASAHRTVLLIDEADSLLSSRDGDVRKHEVNLTNILLQELESFPGVVILTTNRAPALDSALERRLTAKIEFKPPASLERQLLWRRYLPARAPLAEEVDLGALAASYELTGATIRLACLEAAAAACGRSGKEAVIKQGDLEEAAEAQAGKRQAPRTTVGFRSGEGRAMNDAELLQLVAKA